MLIGMIKLLRFLDLISSHSLSELRASEYQSQIDDLRRERLLLIQQLTSQPSKIDIESQTTHDIDL